MNFLKVSLRWLATSRISPSFRAVRTNTATRRTGAAPSGSRGRTGIPSQDKTCRTAFPSIRSLPISLDRTRDSRRCNSTVLMVVAQVTARGCHSLGINEANRSRDTTIPCRYSTRCFHPTTYRWSYARGRSLTNVACSMPFCPKPSACSVGFRKPTPTSWTNISRVSATLKPA